MIVRINQIDPTIAEQSAGWGSTGLAADLPPDTRAMEMLILSQDENRQPLSDSFRQEQFRQLLPQIAIALREAGQSPVLRLDGPVSPQELLPAWRHLVDTDGRGRYAFSAGSRLGISDGSPSATVLLAASWKGLAAACTDAELGFERNVRARLFLCTDDQVSALLSTTESSAAAAKSLLSACPVVVQPTRSLRSLQLYVRGLDVPQVKQKIMGRMMAVARGEPAIPA